MKKILLFLILVLIFYPNLSSFSVINATGINLIPKEDGSLEIEIVTPDGIKKMLEDNRTSKKDRIVSNPLDDLVLVNKKWGLPSDFIPPDLVVPDIPFLFREVLPKRKVRKKVAQALEKLFRQAKKERIDIIAFSGYRSYKRQNYLFSYYKRKLGKRKAVKLSAKPGHSEHQTGLAIDISSRSVGYKLIQKRDSFAQSKEGRWLKIKAPQYGFIIRYPRGKKDITGYQYEPWHFRYVGVSVALEISKNNLTLEEYLSRWIF